ncbi:MAG TPA: zinc ABC transporter substrate-binding protein [Microbacteriaceae bacterium]|nr:zinc ABC transporter substrate-binding protein [Microbacteriaceae bacterium]
MNRRFVALPLIAAAAALTLAGCASGASADPASTGSGAGTGTVVNVVASTDVWGDIAATVGGDHVKVTSIIDDPDKDPHEYEADARNQLAISKASVVIENGGGYDDFVNTMLKSAKSDSRTVLNAVDISGKKASGANELNEHVWYDFGTVEKVVDKLSATYAKLDKKHAAAYTKNADALKSKLDALESRESDLKTKYAGLGASITEPVPLYMLDAIGLNNKTPEKFSEAIENDSDVAPTVLKQTLELYSSHAVALLAYNEQTTGAQTEAVLKAAKDAGIAVVPVTETLPSGKTYVSWMTANLDAVAAALNQSAPHNSAQNK